MELHVVLALKPVSSAFSHKCVGWICTDWPCQFLFLRFPIKGVVHRVLDESLCWDGDVHHPNKVLFGHAGTGRDGVRIAPVALHGRHAEGLSHAAPEVGVVHRVQSGLGCGRAERDPRHHTEEQGPLPARSVGFSRVPQLGHVERRPGDKEHRVEHEEHLDGFDLSPGYNVHGTAHCATICTEAPDVADHPLVERHDQQRRNQEPEEKVCHAVHDAIPAVGEEEIAVLHSLRSRTVEEEAGGDEGGVKHPGRQDHPLGFLPGHLEAQWVDDGVESVHADGEEHVDLHTGAEVLEVADGLAGGCTQGPVTDAHLQQDEGTTAQAQQQVSTGHGHHKIVGGGLSSAAAVDDQAHQGIAKNGDEPKHPKHEAKDSHLSWAQVVRQDGGIWEK